MDVPEARAPRPVDRRPRGTWKARYNSGYCYACGRAILAGDILRWQKRGGVRTMRHYACERSAMPAHR